MFKNLIISAPFGNWLTFQGCTSTLGTFTHKRRGGLLYRAWRCLLTLRYHRKTQAWTNKLGLPNPGLFSLTGNSYPDNIISIYGFDRYEWEALAYQVLQCNPLAVELNLSCPNVSHQVFLADVMAAVKLLRFKVAIIAKLPPVKWMSLAAPLYDEGVWLFHCCNTIPTPGGGMSGKPLKQYSLWAIEDLRQRWGSEVRLIGGGGVTTIQDLDDYRKTGADHVAVGSLLLNPLNWPAIKQFNRHLEATKPTLNRGNRAMPTEYYDDTTVCPHCKEWINLDGPRDPGPEFCPKCQKRLREKDENPRKDRKIIPAS